MIGEIGLASLCLAAVFSVLLSLSVFFDVANPKRLAGGIFLAITLAFGCLLTAFAFSDFSVQTVFAHSHTAKPMLYKLTGTWGNHEGSMLLWVWVLGLFTCLLAWANPPGKLTHHALAVLGFVVLGFVCFILFTSNPFARIFPPPWQGQSLNPLLQDIGLAIHPPLLYLGYVGFSVVFALAVSALWTGTPVNKRWVLQVRPWALLAWAFLTAGIALGSWWAYRELGWGGWWFWDPVENVSLLPWLAGTALIHCLVILARKEALQNWTLLLAITTFIFSLLGTFLVRSGLLTSVHSFASDPTRGMYVLIFITVLTGGSLWLFARRYPAPSPPDFLPASREGAIMINNILLATLCATVLLGIVYPLALQALEAPSVSVGAPYYNQVFLPIALPVLFLAGISPFLPWNQATWKSLQRPLRQVGAATIIILACWLVALPLTGLGWLAWAGLVTGSWLVGASGVYILRQLRSAKGIAPEQGGLILAHLGLGLVALAVTTSSAFREEQEIWIQQGQSAQFSGYDYVMESVERGEWKNYAFQRVNLRFSSDGETRFTLTPETRHYSARGMETAEAAIRTTLAGDIYAAISPVELPQANGQSQLVLKLYSMPGMFWLWTGFLFITMGGMIAAVAHFRLLVPD